MEVRNLGALVEFWTAHADAEKPLQHWLAIVRSAAWQTPLDCRQTFAHADPVSLPGNRIVWVFNIKGNQYRLIAAIQYPRQLLVVLAVMTHAEYSRDRWKDTV